MTEFSLTSLVYQRDQLALALQHLRAPRDVQIYFKAGSEGNNANDRARAAVMAAAKPFIEGIFAAAVVEMEQHLAAKREQVLRAAFAEIYPPE